MNIQEFLTKTHIINNGFIMRPRIICNDGFNMSVQAGYTLYSTPRTNENMFSSCEIGFPSKKENLIMEYAEEPRKPLNTVYGYVPIEVIEEVIGKHGGININETFKQA